MTTVSASLWRLIDVLGQEATLDFLLEFGGSRLYVGSQPRGGSRVVACLGREKAQALGRAFHRQQVDIPSARRWIALRLNEQGMSGYEIARTLHTDSRTVRRWLADKNKDQLDLFPDA